MNGRPHLLLLPAASSWPAWTPPRASSLWKNSDRDLLEAIGRDGPAQLWLTGYATTTFIKCNDRYVFFAGPQRQRLVVASTDNGKLLWQKEPGNLQLSSATTRSTAAGQQANLRLQLAYATGEQLGELPARRACTRATGTVDSVFFRATGGTVRIDVASGTAKHIAPMRPPCQDGVIVSDGLLYWGPWMCGCQLSLYGHICLGPAGRFNFHPPADASRLATAAGIRQRVQPLAVDSRRLAHLPGRQRAGAARPTSSCRGRSARRWTYQVPGGARPDRARSSPAAWSSWATTAGALRALDAADGSLRWQAHTGGAIFFPPALWQGRLYAGSADGRVYAFEAATGRLLWTFRAAPAERLDSRLRPAAFHLAGGRRRGRRRRRGVCRRRHRPLRRHLRLRPGCRDRPGEVVQRFLGQPVGEGRLRHQPARSAVPWPAASCGSSAAASTRRPATIAATGKCLNEPDDAPDLALPHGLLALFSRLWTVYVAQPRAARRPGAVYDASV